MPTVFFTGQKLRDLSGKMRVGEFYRQFSSRSECIELLEDIRWGEDCPICPYCSSDKNSAIPSEDRHHCNNCHTTFSVTVDTAFERTRLDLQKWFAVLVMVLDPYSEPSGREIAREVGINKNTACRINLKVRRLMHEEEHRTMLVDLVRRLEDRVSYA